MPVVATADFAPSRRAAYGLVLTAHNRASSLGVTLPSLLSSIAGEWEMAVVLDDCHDSSRDVLLSLLPRASSCTSATAGHGSAGFLHRYVVFETAPRAPPLFETASENLGMRLLDPTFAFLLVQSDVVAHEPGWNLWLAAAMAADRSVTTVSGRCAMPGQRSHNRWCAGNGRKERGRVPVAKQAVAFRGLTPRGPLLLRANAARALGYLDEGCFHMGADDFDLEARAYNFFGWQAAYVYIDVHQPPNLHQWQVARKGKQISQADTLKKAEKPRHSLWRSEGLPRGSPGRAHGRRCPSFNMTKQWENLQPSERAPFRINTSWLRAAFAEKAGGCGGSIPASVEQVINREPQR